MFYLPSDYVNNCNVVYSDYIRSYTNTARTEWVDIYFKDDYLLRRGSSNYSSTVICDTLNTYTDDIMYKFGYQNTILSVFILSFVFAIFLLNLRGFNL